MRKPILAANWKMNKLNSEVCAYCEILKQNISATDVDVVVIPPFTNIQIACECFSNTDIKVGAQNLYPEDKGAYTGEVSAPMLVDIGATYCICGHSERRTYFNETDEFVNKKVLKCLEKDLLPILCVGESLEQRQSGVGEEFVLSQVQNCLKDLSGDEALQVVIAYEPIWAIGTGKSATVDDAQSMIGAIRNTLKSMYGNEISQKIRIQYGGSVKAENISDFMKCEDIDGALIGGAGLDANSFAQIIKNVQILSK